MKYFTIWTRTRGSEDDVYVPIITTHGMIILLFTSCKLVYTIYSSSLYPQCTKVESNGPTKLAT